MTGENCKYYNDQILQRSSCNIHDEFHDNTDIFRGHFLKP